MQRRLFAAPLRAATALLAGWALAPTALAVEYDMRGLHRFDSHSGCPIGAENDDAAKQCNRLVLDDDFVRADLFAKQHTVNFSTRPGGAPQKRTVGDVVIHGQARSSQGATVPVSVQVVVETEGGVWRAHPVAHAPVEGPLSAVRIDPYRISATENGATKVLFTAEQAQQLLADPSAAARQQQVQLTDNRLGKTAEPGRRLADVTLGLAGRPTLRGRLEVRRDAVTRDTMPDTLLRGDWQLDLDALEGGVSAEVVRRTLFVLGLDREPMLRPLRERGLVKGTRLAIGVKQQRGFLRLNGKEIEYDHAAQAGTTFLLDTALGLALTWRVLTP